jgi:hypothetical protein
VQTKAGLTLLFCFSLQPIDQTKDSLVLSCQEVRVERRVLIRLVLPWDKHLAIKAGPGRKLSEVLRPILASHNLELQRMTSHLAHQAAAAAAGGGGRVAAMVHGHHHQHQPHLPTLKVEHFTAHRAGEEASLSMKVLATNLDNETIVLKYKEGPGVYLFDQNQLSVEPIDYRCDNTRFWLSAHNCQVPTPTSQNLKIEQQIRIFGAD